MNKIITVYFRSGRSISLDEQSPLGPSDLASAISDRMPAGAIVMSIGPHLVFIREIERIVIKDAHSSGGRDG